ncbi:hypothetical protein BOX15_Mlig008865g1, partial [Macrostomum lignano]
PDSLSDIPATSQAMSRVGNLPMESLSVSVGGPSSSVSRNRTELRSNSSGGIRQLSASAYPGSPTGWELGRRPSVVFGESETTEELAKTRFMRSNKQQKKHEERMDKNRQAVEDQLREFMKRHFHRKECCLFEEKDAGKCACGEVRDKHDRQFLQTGSTEKWAAEKHLQKVGATNAFGRIRLMNEGFDNREPINFVRLCDEDDMGMILDLMKTHWKMSEPQQPSLCISVIGGAKNFKLEGRKKEVFHHGLIRAAQTTNAWIITSGLNLGITRVVGNALEEGRASHWEKASRSSKLRCIGVAPWGYVLNKDDLVNKESPGGQFSLDVEYKISSVLGKGQPVSLNANHTHYLLVDDGKRNRYGGSKSSVIKAQLQKQINVTEKIPVVLLIVEGGFDIFEEMESMISANIPIVACDNTGRAADIIAFAFKKLHKSDNKTLTEAHRADLLNRIKEAFGDNLRDPRTKEVSPAKMEEMLQTLLKLVSNEKLITVFDMNRSDDLDLAILSALLKVMDAKQLEDYKRQLNLSLTWNRSDIAAEKIFTEELQWDTASLEDFTLQAIKEDKMDFLKLFLNNGLIMKEFLTVKQLRNLYRSHLKAGDKNPATVQIRKLLGSRARCKSAESVRLSSIRLLLRRLIGKFQSPDMDEDVGGRDEPPNDAVDGRQLDRPFNQLFFWAVLFGRQTMARFLWERTDEAVPLALAACKVLDEMAKSLPSHEDVRRRSLIEFKAEFEELSVRVIEECQSVDPGKSEMLIEKRVDVFGNFNCLELAASANCKKFLACNSSQNSVNRRWLNGLLHGTSNLSILACVLLPFLLPSDRVLQAEPDAIEDALSDSGGGVDSGGDGGSGGGAVSGSACSRLCVKTKIFYTAPVTKFFSNAICYVFFLLFYSYFILFSLKQAYMTWLEWLVMAWVWVMIIDEIREMFSSKADTVREKLHDWWNFSVWNRLDLVTILLTLLGMFMRIPDSTDSIFLGIRTCYILAGVFFYLRVFRLYYVNSYLGPKLVMINKMVKELLFYLSILLIPLLTYGVAAQALLYPNRQFLAEVFKDIVYYPYWQMYGQLYIEVAEADPPSGCSGNSTVDDQGNPCPTAGALVLILLAVYLMVVDILLLNLLIAIFSNIFEEIERNAIEIWKYNMYFLVQEYHNKPVLALPFVVFEDFFIFGRMLFNKISCKKKPDEANQEDKALSQDELRNFAAHCLIRVHRRRDEEVRLEISNRMTGICDGLEDLYKICDRIDERFEDQLHHGHGHRRDEACSSKPDEKPDGKSAAKPEVKPEVKPETMEWDAPAKMKVVPEIPVMQPVQPGPAKPLDKENLTPDAPEAQKQTKPKRRRHRSARRQDRALVDDQSADIRMAEMESRLQSMEAATTESLTSIERLLRQIFHNRPSGDAAGGGR